MKRLLIILNDLKPYRLALFDRLSERFAVTVAYSSGREPPQGVSFRTRAYKARDIAGLRVASREIIDLARTQDVIVALHSLRMFPLLTQLLRGDLRRKTILWGIGVGSSRGYGSHAFLDPLRVAVANRAAALLVYDEAAASLYRQSGLDEQRVLVARNSVEDQGGRYVHERSPAPEDWLFVGALDARKRVGDVIDALVLLRSDLPRTTLHVVGDGPQRKVLERHASASGVGDRVVFHGALTAPTDLAPMYRTSLAAVSPGQAGLSVSQAFSFGCPFVTRADAISGGEISAIVPGRNGLLYTGGPDSLAQVLTTLHESDELSRQLSRGARSTFESELGLDNMVSAFSQAIEQCISGGGAGW